MSNWTRLNFVEKTVFWGLAFFTMGMMATSGWRYQLLTGTSWYVEPVNWAVSYAAVWLACWMISRLFFTAGSRIKT